MAWKECGTVRGVKFIHAADLHLGSVFSGFQHMHSAIYDKIKNSGYSALTRLVDTAIQERIDFVIFAGDIYDNEERNLKAQLKFKAEMERLENYSIPVYLIHGNHDYMNGNYFDISLPANVHLYGREVEVKQFIKENDATTVNLYGFSYDKRHIHDRVIQEYKKADDADYHIGILHGNLDGESAHGNYAPFTRSELLSKQFDYWALGHIHKRMEILQEPPAIYPGCLQGRNKKETGEKGFYLVSMSGSDTSLEFVPVSTVEWKTETIQADHISSVNELIAELDKIKEGAYEPDKSILLNIMIDASDCKMNPEWLFVDMDHLLEGLQDEEMDEISVWIHSCTLIPPRYASGGGELSDTFIDELLRTTVNMNSEQYLKYGEALFTHSAARKYIEPWEENEWQQILDEATLELVKRLNR
ncbi:DNA repair exonuclease [Bacillus sp. E214]|uniref:metallophosphoesterase family protein n=1 Tax=Bacillus sp. E214 TaxID=2587156 RepID=UPI001123B874|nr:DNA repair exonuclease [Bacillus sp. E214]